MKIIKNKVTIAHYICNCILFKINKRLDTFSNIISSNNTSYYNYTKYILRITLIRFFEKPLPFSITPSFANEDLDKEVMEQDFFQKRGKYKKA